MEVSRQERRLYTLFACFQAAFVMIGTFAVRAATSETFNAPGMRMHWSVYALRNWGYLLLLIPVGCLVWARRDMQKYPGGRRSTNRLLAGLALTVLLEPPLLKIWLLASSEQVSSPIPQ